MSREDAPRNFEEAEPAICFGDQQEFTLLSVIEETNADDTRRSLTLFFKELNGNVRAIQLARLVTVDDLAHEDQITFVDEITPLTVVEVLTQTSKELRQISVPIDL